MRRSLLALGLVLAATAPTLGRQAQEPVERPPVPLALVTTYADGRVSHNAGGPRGGGYWTPMFPRLPSAPSLAPGHLPVTALKCDWKRDGARLQVAVSLLLGTPHQQELPVAVATVGVGETVTVEALAAFGVAPIRLSAKPIAPVAGFQPRVINRTAGLEVTAVDVVSEPIPGYNVTVTNLSSKGVRSFDVRSYHDGRRALVGRQGDRENKVIVAPGDSYTFRWGMSSEAPRTEATWAPSPVDEIEISSVLWDDNTHEGERQPAIDALLLNEARRQQLIRVVDILRRATSDTRAAAELMPHLLAQAEALPIVATSRDVLAVRSVEPSTETRSTASLESTIAIACQQVRNAVSDDLRTAVHRGAVKTPGNAAAFVKEILEHYEGWLARVSGPR